MIMIAASRSLSSKKRQFSTMLVFSYLLYYVTFCLGPDLRYLIVVFAFQILYSFPSQSTFKKSLNPSPIILLTTLASPQQRMSSPFNLLSRYGVSLLLRLLRMSLDMFIVNAQIRLCVGVSPHRLLCQEFRIVEQSRRSPYQLWPNTLPGHQMGTHVHDTNTNEDRSVQWCFDKDICVSQW